MKIRTPVPDSLTPCARPLVFRLLSRLPCQLRAACVQVSGRGTSVQRHTWLSPILLCHHDSAPFEPGVMASRTGGRDAPWAMTLVGCQLQGKQNVQALRAADPTSLYTVCSELTLTGLGKRPLKGWSTAGKWLVTGGQAVWASVARAVYLGDACSPARTFCPALLAVQVSGTCQSDDCAAV